MSLKASSSIVLYNNSFLDIKNCLKSLLNEQEIDVVYLIDNSPKEIDFSIDKLSKVKYIRNSKNIGFGAAHNIAIRKSIKKGYSYHFVVNPDVFFNKGVITDLLSYANSDLEIAMVMPKILNQDGSHQNLPKLFPTIYSVVIRRLNLSQTFLKKYELRDLSEPLNVPTLSGCFTLLNLKIIKKNEGYDEQFFLYFEDWDLSRRLHQNYKTMYFPKVSINHLYKTKHRKKLKLIVEFIKSMIKYFNKWGWMLNDEQKKINKQISITQTNE